MKKTRLGSSWFVFGFLAGSLWRRRRRRRFFRAIVGRIRTYGWLRQFQTRALEQVRGGRRQQLERRRASSTMELRQRHPAAMAIRGSRRQQLPHRRSSQRKMPRRFGPQHRGRRAHSPVVLSRRHQSAVDRGRHRRRSSRGARGQQRQVPGRIRREHRRWWPDDPMGVPRRGKPAIFAEPAARRRHRRNWWHGGTGAPVALGRRGGTRARWKRRNRLCGGGTTHYVDPATGSTSGDGTAQRPWRTVQEVVQAGHLGSRIRAGDTVLLRTGYHGELLIDGGSYATPITIAAEPGHTPRLRRVQAARTSGFVLRGLSISPSHAPTYAKATIVDIQSSASNVTVGQLRHFQRERAPRPGPPTTGSTRASSGVQVSGGDVTVKNSRVKNVRFGISASGAERADRAQYRSTASRPTDCAGSATSRPFSTTWSRTRMPTTASTRTTTMASRAGRSVPGGVGTGEVRGIVLRGKHLHQLRKLRPAAQSHAAGHRLLRRTFRRLGGRKQRRDHQPLARDLALRREKLAHRQQHGDRQRQRFARAAVDHGERPQGRPAERERRRAQQSGDRSTASRARTSRRITTPSSRTTSRPTS